MSWIAAIAAIAAFATVGRCTAHPAPSACSAYVYMREKRKLAKKKLGSPSNTGASSY
jgi:hypothetical protein